MKKFPALFIAVAVAAACNNGSSITANTDTMVSTGMSDTSVPAVTADTVNVAYVPADGDIEYKDGKVYVMENGSWTEAHHDITLSNGEVVYYKTHTVKKDGETVELKTDEIVSKTGRFFDRTGHAIANAWDDTKDAVSDAGKDVGRAAAKAGKKIDSVVTGKKRQ